MTEINAVIFDLNGVLLRNAPSRIWSSVVKGEKKSKVNKKLLSTVQKIKEKGLKTGIISNLSIDKDGLQEDFGKPLNKLFDIIISAPEEGILKPNESIYRKALDKLNVEPENTLFIDDMRRNVAGAKTINIQAIHFKDAESTISKMKELGVLDNQDL